MRAEVKPPLPTFINKNALKQTDRETRTPGSRFLEEEILFCQEISRDANIRKQELQMLAVWVAEKHQICLKGNLLVEVRRGIEAQIIKTEVSAICEQRGIMVSEDDLAAMRWIIIRNG